MKSEAGTQEDIPLAMKMNMNIKMNIRMGFGLLYSKREKGERKDNGTGGKKHFD